VHGGSSGFVASLLFRDAPALHETLEGSHV